MSSVSTGPEALVAGTLTLCPNQVRHYAAAFTANILNLQCRLILNPSSRSKHKRNNGPRCLVPEHLRHLENSWLAPLLQVKDKFRSLHLFSSTTKSRRSSHLTALTAIISYYQGSKWGKRNTDMTHFLSLPLPFLSLSLPSHCLPPLHKFSCEIYVS